MPELDSYNEDWKKTDECGLLTSEDVGREVVLNGWVSRRRDLGGIIFLSLRNRTGIIQIVCDPDHNKKVAEKAHQLRTEFVVGVKGSVVARSPETVNADMNTGEIEVRADDLAIFNTSETTPFEIRDDTNANEDLRLKYRYLDLRRPRLQKALMLRHAAALAVRNFLNSEGFLEIETPILTRSTPEGARDYLVPSRNYRGSFYALPQSPQLFKQLLMVSGFDRYFQIARCFRDEDFRADRQPEFTQIDMELAFVEPDDIYDLIERMLAGLFEIVGLDIQLPFPVMDYHTAMNKYGSDRPDLRLDLPLTEFSSLVEDSEFKVFSGTVASGGVVKGICVPGGADLSRKQIDEAEAVAKTHGAKGLAWIKRTTEGFSGPIVKFLGDDLCEKLFQEAGGEEGSALFMVADKWVTSCEALGAVRLHFGKALELIDKDAWKFLWVVDFPLFEDDGEGNPTPMHHPFTALHPEDHDMLESEPLKVRSRAYDVILNGNELGGGSIRIHDTDLQQRVLKVLGIDEKEAQERFGFLLDALTYGAPPLGGIALGFDRLVMLMAGEDAIRNVIAFPKTTSAMCLMTKAPANVDEDQTQELGLKVISKDSLPAEED